MDYWYSLKLQHEDFEKTHVALAPGTVGFMGSIVKNNDTVS